jgi:cobalamin biosynthesis protein CbiD
MTVRKLFENGITAFCCAAAAAAAAALVNNNKENNSNKTKTYFILAPVELKD